MKARALRSSSAWACFALVMLVPAGRAGLAASRPATSAVEPEAEHVSATSPGVPRFRLGNAARPFGWSTAIGDFNTDGKPDFAVADRIGRWASEYAYRIELSISGQPPGDVTFRSTHDAVSITLFDVDRDNDLDIVVGVPLSAETVGVWLNDGQGHFTSSDVPRWPASLQAQQTLESEGSSTALAVFESSPRRIDQGLPVVTRAPPSPAAHRTAVSDGRHRWSSLAALRPSPRAPPTSSADSLS